MDVFPLKGHGTYHFRFKMRDPSFGYSWKVCVSFSPLSLSFLSFFLISRMFGIWMSFYLLKTQWLLFKHLTWVYYLFFFDLLLFDIVVTHV